MKFHESENSHNLVVCLFELFMTPVALQKCPREEKYHTTTNIDSSANIVYNGCSCNEISLMQT